MDIFRIRQYSVLMLLIEVVNWGCDKNGTCIGIIQWMSVKLYEDIQYENIPGDVSSHWSTPIYLFDEPIKVRVGDRVSINAFLGKDSVWFYK